MAGDSRLPDERLVCRLFDSASWTTRDDTWLAGFLPCGPLTDQEEDEGAVYRMPFAIRILAVSRTTQWPEESARLAAFLALDTDSLLLQSRFDTYEGLVPLVREPFVWQTMLDRQVNGALLLQAFACLPNGYAGGQQLVPAWDEVVREAFGDVGSQYLTEAEADEAASFDQIGRKQDAGGVHVCTNVLVPLHFQSGDGQAGLAPAGIGRPIAPALSESRRLDGLDQSGATGTRRAVSLQNRPRPPAACSDYHQARRQLLLTAVWRAFFDLDAYRLEWEIGGAERHWLPVLNQDGWREEGRLELARPCPGTFRREDVLLLCLQKPSQPFRSVAFVPFRQAVLALVADDKGVWQTDFVRYGRPCLDPFIQETAQYMHLLDSQGNVPDLDSFAARLGGRAWVCPEQAPELLRQAASQVHEYFQGKRRVFDLPLHLDQGSPFQQRVWQELRQIPHAVTRTYEAVAEAIGPDDTNDARKLARAVGSACSANPIPLIVPCHRVIGKDGKLVGFSGGLDIKAYLLSYEILGVS